MSIRDQIVEDIVSMELFNTYTIMDGKKVPTYVYEGYDKEKIESEGSTWYVYKSACMSDYYHKYKTHIDDMVDAELRAALGERRKRNGKGQSKNAG